MTAVACAEGKGKSAEFELPENLSEDDEALLHGILCALCSTDLCTGYRVDTASAQNCFMIRGQLSAGNFELDLDDLHFIRSASPLRVERVLVARCGEQIELLIKVLNSKQRVMLTDASVFYVTTRKRKQAKIGSA